MNLELLRELSVPTTRKILLLVIDGLGGLPNASGRSELEQANIPQLDRLAQESLCGLTMPVGYGVTPGSGPGHLALFGYDPEKYTVGRGVLEALGIDFDLQSTDVAARGNFCTVDAEGRITDRRAGRIATEQSAPLCEKLSRRSSCPACRCSSSPCATIASCWCCAAKASPIASRETDPQREGAAAAAGRARSRPKPRRPPAC